MIQEIITSRCRCCDSVNSVKNGRNAQGQQQYWCKDCNKRAVLHRTALERREEFSKTIGLTQLKRKVQLLQQYVR